MKFNGEHNSTIGKEKIRKWLFNRAEMHQDRGEWGASFEDLYLVTAIFRGDFVAGVK